jgi:alkanesulfonate monooxygenase SsuD/methylene tetrahydromethanopterin reductase-like flavin-dependent oxidoreductase (luciferase family)
VIGGQGEKRTLRIAAQWADEWNFPMGAPFGTPEQFAHKAEVLRRHCADVGRDPSEITLSMQQTCGADPIESAARIAAFVDAGVQHVCLYFDDNSDAKLLGRTVDAVIARVGLSG